MLIHSNYGSVGNIYPLIFKYVLVNWSKMDISRGRQLFRNFGHQGSLRF